MRGTSHYIDPIARRFTCPVCQVSPNQFCVTTGGAFPGTPTAPHKQRSRKARLLLNRNKEVSARG